MTLRTCPCCGKRRLEPTIFWRKHNGVLAFIRICRVCGPVPV